MSWRAEESMTSTLKRVLSLIMAVVSELQSGRTILRRAIVVLIVLGLPIFFFGRSFPLSSFMTAGLIVGVSSLFTAISWFKDERLRGLFILPFSRQSVAAAVCAVGMLSAGISDAIPITFSFYLTGTLSTANALITVGVGVLASTFSFVCIALLRSLGMTIRMNLKPLQSYAFIPEHKSFASTINREGGFSRVRCFMQKQVFSNYFLASIYRDANTWFSLLGLMVFGLVATDFILSKGMPFPVHAICVALTPPLSTLLSRDLHTRRQMLVLKNDRTIAAQYMSALMTVVMPLILLGDVLLVLLGRLVDIKFIVASIAVYLAAIIVIIVLEMRFPLLKWKTENEMYRHPRRYLPILAAVLVAGVFFLI